MRYLLALFAFVLALTVPAAPAHAQACDYNAFRQHDMMGIYTDANRNLRVEIYPCGGVYVEWFNAYGLRYATYFSDTRLTGGGVAAGYAQGNGPLDGTERIGFKPAEPGFIQVITVTPYAEIVGVYRLRKIG